MFPNKQYEYLRFKDVLLTGIIYSDNLPAHRSDVNIHIVESIINIHYFYAWLVLFIEAEGCFSVYKLNKNEYYFIASLNVAHKNGQVLITAIRKYLSFTTTVYKGKTNCYKLKVSSVRSLENVVKFLNNAPVKLLDNKKLQYLLFLKQLRTIPRYKKN